MSSYLWHEGDSFLAPPPPEYAEMTVERAMWQAFGKRADEMTWLEYETKSVLLVVESEKQKANSEQKS